MATDSNNSTRCDLCRLCLSAHVPTVHVLLLWVHVFTCLDAWTAGILWNCGIAQDTSPISSSLQAETCYSRISNVQIPDVTV